MNDYDIRTRTADEGRVPISKLIQSHEVSQGGVLLRQDDVHHTTAEKVGKVATALAHISLKPAIIRFLRTIPVPFKRPDEKYRMAINVVIIPQRSGESQPI
jgi:hypothetical protein